MAVSAFHVMRAYWVIHLKSIMEYRTSFIVQSVFMFLNDAVFACVLYLLFKGLGDIQGYGYQDAIVIFGIAALSLSFVEILFGSGTKIISYVLEGKFDVLLSQPVDPLFHAVSTHRGYDAVGDFLLGIVVLVLFVPDKALLGVGVAFFGGLIFLAFEIIAGSLAFFLGRPKAVARLIRYAFVAFGTWPIDVFTPSMRALLYILPFAFVSTVPFHLITGFSWGELGLLALVSALTLAFAVALFNLGLRRYESGNLMSLRG